MKYIYSRIQMMHDKHARKHHSQTWHNHYFLVVPHLSDAGFDCVVSERCFMEGWHGKRLHGFHHFNIDSWVRDDITVILYHLNIKFLFRVVISKDWYGFIFTPISQIPILYNLVGCSMDIKKEIVLLISTNKWRSACIAFAYRDY